MTQSTPANGLVIDEIEVGSGETAVKGHLLRVMPVNRFMAIQHLYGQGSICRIAFDDQTVRDEIGSSTGYTYFMPIILITSILYDDVGMGLEDGKNLLLSGNLFILDDPADRLINDILGQGKDLFDFLDKSHCLKPVHC